MTNEPARCERDRSCTRTVTVVRAVCGFCGLYRLTLRSNTLVRFTSVCHSWHLVATRGGTARGREGEALMAIRRDRAVATLLCATLFVALTSCTSTHASRPSAERASARPSSPAATPSRIPGADPSIQHWFLRVANAQIAFDNALFRAEQGIAKHVAWMCRPLQHKAQPLLSALPSLRNNPSPAGPSSRTRLSRA